MKILFVGDAACDSGFAKATHFYLQGPLSRGHEVAVLGLNYLGNPHTYPYPIYPCWPGGDFFGVKRLLEVCDQELPDCIVIQQDPWNFPAYTNELKKLRDHIPVLGIVAVDGLNARGMDLNGLDHAIFWTEFGRREALKGGMLCPSSVIPLGVDLEAYQPGDKVKARKQLGLPENCWDAYVVGNVNRNQPRKRLDLTLRYFSRWIHEYAIKDAILYLHVCPTGDQGYNIEQLARYYGLQGRIIVAAPDVFKGPAEAFVAATLRSFDLQFSTTQGEGFGLTTLEGMACRRAQLLPGWSALAEWAHGAARLVPCTSTCMTPVANAVGGVMDEEKAIRALDDLYRHPEAREGLAEAGYRRAHEDRFRWEDIAWRFIGQVETTHALVREQQRRERDECEVPRSGEGSDEGGRGCALPGGAGGRDGGQASDSGR